MKSPIQGEEKRQRLHGEACAQERPGQTSRSGLTQLSKCLLSPTEEALSRRLVPKHTSELSLGMFLSEL